MSKQQMTKAAIKRRTISAMKSLGTYRKEYDTIIDMYAALVEEYANLMQQFVDGGCQYEVSTGAEGVKKSPTVASLESLRKDILQYSDRLCLNPKAMKEEVSRPKKKSILAQVLSEGRT